MYLILDIQAIFREQSVAKAFDGNALKTKVASSF